MKQINFKAEIILNKKFSTEISGYNSTEVDQLFDKVIEDYQTFEERINSLQETIEEDAQIISEKEESIKQLKLEILNLKDQLSNTEKATNIDLMKELKTLKEMMKEQNINK